MLTHKVYVSLISTIVGALIFIFTTFATRESVEKYVDAKHDDVKENIKDVKDRLRRIEDILLELSKGQRHGR